MPGILHIVAHYRVAYRRNPLVDKGVVHHQERFGTIFAYFDLTLLADERFPMIPAQPVLHLID